MDKILISDAAKQVNVESHVLRYWEEELQLPIQRNKQGHRYYTAEDVDRFRQIKKMKEQGFQLKAIRNALKGNTNAGEELPEQNIGKEELGKAITFRINADEVSVQSDKTQKAARLQLLLQHMISQAVKENNIELCENIRETVVKELDFQFRQHEEAAAVREEGYYKKLDELLRAKTGVKEKRKHLWSRRT